MDDCFDLIRAISDPTRFTILGIILRHDLCAGAIARRMGITEAAVSQHIKVLKDVGLVRAVRCGHYMHYAVDRELIRRMSDMFSEMAVIERHPCDPSAEGCTAKRLDSCPSEKGVGRCPKLASGEPSCRGCTIVIERTGGMIE